MRITSKGQVTIPQYIRERLGLMPHTEVEFELDGKTARLRKARGRSKRAQRAIDALRGTANAGFTTDEIMALTRGED
jgi:AbrB family looped-hinge helix DNA binding protein